MTQASDDLVGQLVEDRYRIEGLLGAGGMGSVYRARHVTVGREVAIKVLHAHLLSDPVMVERFEREAAIAARLAHRNLVSVIDVGETAQHQKLMVLELARGRTLAEIIAGGPLPRERVIALTAQLLAGLGHAHDAGLVHRDLKPDNVIVELDEHGRELPRIVDFGVALLRDERRLTSAGIVLGTPQYMAPEHAQGHAVDARTDLFALGVMVYEMLAGALPFDGTGVEVALANVTQDPPAILTRTGVTVDPVLEAFARRLMARRLRDRFGSARAAADVLALIETDDAAARELLTPPARDPRVTSLGTAAPARSPAPRARGSAPPSTTPPRRVDPATDLPRVFAARVVGAGATRSRAESERLGLAATLEAAGTKPRRKQRRKRVPPPPPRPWQPWKSLGLLGGALLAGLLLVTITITRQVTARRVATPLVPIAMPTTVPAPAPVVRATAFEVAPAQR